MEAISQERQVVCLCPSPGGAARHNRIPHTRKISDRLTFVYNAFPIHTSALRSGVASDTAHGDTRAMRRILRSCGIDRYIYWLANPHIDALTGLDRSRLILDCSDPTLFASEATGLMPGTETILREARLVFSASETLCQHLQSHHSSVFHLPNAALPGADMPGEPRDVAFDGLLRGRPGPVVVYAGPLDNGFEFDYVVEAARTMPGMTFVISGEWRRGIHHHLTNLSALPNVLLPGRLPGAVLQSGLAHVAVGLFPYRPASHYAHRDLELLYTYLAAGIPVVTTCLHECWRHAPWVTRRAYGSQHQWSDRARTVQNLIQQHFGA
jgi:glycosyltransferase involved in cell wall biosynthesis